MNSVLMKKQLTGRGLKRDLKIHRAFYRFHNRNTKGGNFGINLEMSAKYQDTHFELRGHYNTSGEVVSLGFGKLYQPNVSITPIPDYETLVEYIRNRIHTILAIERI